MAKRIRSRYNNITMTRIKDMKKIKGDEEDEDDNCIFCKDTKNKQMEILKTWQ